MWNIRVISIWIEESSAKTWQTHVVVVKNIYLRVSPYTTLYDDPRHNAMLWWSSSWTKHRNPNFLLVKRVNMGFFSKLYAYTLDSNSWSNPSIHCEMRGKVACAVIAKRWNSRPLAQKIKSAVGHSVSGLCMFAISAFSSELYALSSLEQGTCTAQEHINTPGKFRLFYFSIWCVHSNSYKIKDWCPSPHRLGRLWSYWVRRSCRPQDGVPTEKSHKMFESLCG